MTHLEEDDTEAVEVNLLVVPGISSGDLRRSVERCSHQTGHILLHRYTLNLEVYLCVDVLETYLV